MCDPSYDTSDKWSAIDPPLVSRYQRQVVSHRPPSRVTSCSHRL